MSLINASLQEARRTLALAGPIIVGQVGQMLMGVADSVMIGQVGKVPLAAAAFAGSVFGLVFIVGIGALVPVAVLVSRAHGAGRDDECRQWVQHGVMLAALGSTLAAIGLWGGGRLLVYLGQPPEVLAEVHPYFELIAVSLIPTLVFQALRQYVESLGRPLGPMVILLGGVGLNIALNWVLIYGHLGVPALGLAGAGWATLAARTIVLLVLVIWVRRQSGLRSTWPVRWRVGLSRARFRAMLELGVPTGTSLLFEGGAFTVAAWMMGWIGATALAAHQIALNCATLTFMFPLGLSMAVSMRISRAIGAGALATLRPIGFGALALATCFMGACAAVFALGGRILASGFVHEADVINLATGLLVVAAIFQLFDGVQVVGAGLLRGLADVRVPTLITGTAYWLIALPGGYLLGRHTSWGAYGIWGALAVGLAVAAGCLLSRFVLLTGSKRLAAREKVV